LSGRQIGWCLKRERAQDVGQPIQSRLVGVEPLGVGDREFGDFRFRAPRRNLEIEPVGQGQEVRQRAERNVIAAPHNHRPWHAHRGFDQPL
jgi:hypothetical protein